MEFVFIFILVAVLVALFLRYRGSSGGALKPGQAGQFTQGTLTLTGVSERPDEGDSKGERFCTLSGTIIGPDTQPTEVYGTVVFGETEPWPQVGAEMPVVYKPGKAETSWRFGALPQEPDPQGPEQFGPQDPYGPDGPQDPGQQPPPGFSR